MVRMAAGEVATRDEAKRLTLKARASGSEYVATLNEIVAKRAWEALGYGDFRSYGNAELAGLPLPKLAVEERKAVDAAVRSVQPDATTREVAALTGVDHATVARDRVANATRSTKPVDEPRLTVVPEVEDAPQPTKAVTRRIEPWNAAADELTRRKAMLTSADKASRQAAIRALANLANNALALAMTLDIENECDVWSLMLMDWREGTQ